jgi:hypothetical protein
MSIMCFFYNISFSDFYSSICSSPTVSSLLIFALLVIFLAETPNLRVEMVYDRLVGCGEHVMIRVVRALPPNDSCRILVSLESL